VAGGERWHSQHLHLPLQLFACCKEVKVILIATRRDQGHRGVVFSNDIGRGKQKSQVIVVFVIVKKEIDDGGHWFCGEGTGREFA